MGNKESSRWRGYTPKPLVEDTRRLDFNTPSWRAILEGFAPASGQLVWANSSGESTGTVEFELGRIEENRERVLTLTDQGSDPVIVKLKETKVGLDTRWHSQCPLDCGRRSRTLFLTSDGEVGCRTCLGLLYRASRKSDSRVGACRRDPAKFLEERSRLTTFQSLLVTDSILRKAEKLGFHIEATQPVRTPAG